MGTAAIASKTRSRQITGRYFRFLLRLLLSYLMCSVVGGIVLAWIALHPQRRPLTPAQVSMAEIIAHRELFSLNNVEIAASDQVTLRGWFLQPKDSSRGAVLLLHGVADNRLGMSGYALFFLRNGYAVLLPDARAHGLSDGQYATYGVKERDDIHHWVSWIEENVHPRCVYGFGESMGAAQLLQSLGLERRFCAVIAESSFVSFREVAYDRVGQPFHAGSWLGRTLLRPLIEFAFLYSRVRYGLNFEQASPEEVVGAANAPVLLIHGLEDRNIPPRHSEQIKQRSRGVLWEVPGAGHTGAYSADPQQFEHKALNWFSPHS
jgi:uncharacterized protein